MQENLSDFCSISNFCLLIQKKITAGKAEFEDRQDFKGRGSQTLGCCTESSELEILVSQGIYGFNARTLIILITDNSRSKL